MRNLPTLLSQNRLAQNRQTAKKKLALLTNLQKAETDKYAAAHGVAETTLMENAAAAAAELIQRHYPQGEVAILVGFGNNGGDGLVTARLLAKNGRRVTVLALTPNKMKSAAATAARAKWDGEAYELSPQTAAEHLPRAAVVVDGLFGTGLNRPLDEAVKEVAKICAALADKGGKGKQMVALDCPSGVNGDDGTASEGHFTAARTIAFAAAQPGHYLYPGQAARGELTVADIGIPNSFWDGFTPLIALNHPFLWPLGEPTWESHKYSRGHLLIGGGKEMSGAARLAGAAAVAALKVGGGAATIAVPTAAQALYAATSPEIILRKFADLKGWSELCRRDNVAAIAVGCGGGKAAGAMATVALETAKPIVVDADAITELGGELPKLLHQNAVWTPHRGEFAKVFPESAANLGGARSAKGDGVLLLKGAATIINWDGGCIINGDAPPWLATAGSGDVLSGIIGGLLASGLAANQAAAGGCWLHGKAAAIVGKGLIASELPSALPTAITEASNCEL